MREITLFRLDHRQVRDQRITSHVALTARAIGCTSFVYTGEQDKNMEESLLDVSKRWGGSFSVIYENRIRSFIQQFSGIKVHLTMYGEPHTDTIKTLNNHPDDDILLIVGGAKVPSYIYNIVDFNTAIGWQPHSEVSATAVFLHNLLGNEFLYKKYESADIAIDGSGFKAQRSNKYT